MRTVWNPFTSTSNRIRFRRPEAGFRKLLCFCCFSVALCFLSTTPTQAAVSLQITNFPSEIKINSEFQIEASISGLPSDKEAALKIGVAGSKDYYGYGQIKNGDKFIGYNDTGSCNNTLMIKTDNLGHWEGKLIGKIFTTAEPGDGKLRIRICDPDKSSVSYAIKLTAMDPLPTPEPKKKAEPDPLSDPNVETPMGSLPGDDSNVSTSEETVVSDSNPTTLTSPTRPTNPTNIKLPATFSAQEVLRVLSDTTISASPAASQEATSTPKSHQPDKYVIILGSLSLLGAVIAGIVVFLKSRGFLK